MLFNRHSIHPLSNFIIKGIRKDWIEREVRKVDIKNNIESLVFVFKCEYIKAAIRYAETAEATAKDIEMLNIAADKIMKISNQA